jgi:hypothetical protein
MELSDKEKILVERLRRRQQRLVRWRWFLLISALIYFAIGCFGLVFTLRFLSESGTPGQIVSCTLPVCVGLMVVGIGMAGSLFFSWGGRLETRLLLALIERLPRDD